MQQIWRKQQITRDIKHDNDKNVDKSHIIMAQGVDKIEGCIQIL